MKESVLDVVEKFAATSDKIVTGLGYDRLAYAKRYVKVLRDLRGRVKEDEGLSGDIVVRGAIERYLHLSIESLIDVGFRICSLLGLEKSERYRDVARILRDANVLDEKSSKKLELWIGLMNILVHGYATIDSRKLFGALNEIEELEAIANQLSRYVDEKSIDPNIGSEVDGEFTERIRKILDSRDFIIFAYVFGSRAVGKQSRRSDFDIAIYTARDMEWKEFIGVTHELEDAVKAKVDLVHLNTAPPLLAYEVISKGLPILDRDPPERIEYEVNTLKTFLDLEPRLRSYYEAMFHGA